MIVPTEILQLAPLIEGIDGKLNCASATFTLIGKTGKNKEATRIPKINLWRIPLLIFNEFGVKNLSNFCIDFLVTEGKIDCKTYKYYTISILKNPNILDK